MFSPPSGTVRSADLLVCRVGIPADMSSPSSTTSTRVSNQHPPPSAGIPAGMSSPRPRSQRPLPRARPPVVFCHLHQPRLHRVTLDVPDNPPVLILISDPMIIGFRLPERRPRAAHCPVRKARRVPLQAYYDHAVCGRAQIAGFEISRRMQGRRFALTVEPERQQCSQSNGGQQERRGLRHGGGRSGDFDLKA